ncbi:MAG: TIGR02452 family protein [Lachnospiraceae bacterium]|nr:TIGR02452 family protein [Lachnospiraceae bacterium]
MLFQQHSKRRIKEFEACLALCERDKELMEGIRKSRQETRLWKNPTEDISVEGKSGNAKHDGTKGVVSVTRHSVLRDARELVARYPECRVGVLNFAAPCHPGGSVIRGASGQENSLCRATTLYPCCVTEEMKRDYYDVHRQCEDFMYSDVCAYIPDVICLSSQDGDLCASEADGLFRVDVICCSAPDVSRVFVHNSGKEENIIDDMHIEDLEMILRRRVEGVLRVAVQHKIEVLVLGAFGCGGCGNSPQLVATIFKKALEKYQGFFRTVTFSIYDAPYKGGVYDVFSSVL